MSAEQEIAALIAGTSAVFDVRALRTDRPYRIVQAIEGQLKRFEYEIDNDRVLTVARNDDDEFVAAIDAIEKRTAATRITGAIDREAPSLFAAMARTGERVDLSMALADVLSSEIDFNTELQVGDTFTLAFEQVGFSYGDAPVLQDITLTARRGDVVALVGSSGAGKSTLVDLIPRFIEPTTGRITLDGVDTRDLTLPSGIDAKRFANRKEMRAAVDAHLKGFDISTDLSLHIKAGYSPLAQTNGISLALKIGK